MNKQIKNGLLAAALFVGSFGFQACTTTENPAPVVQENEKEDGLTISRYNLTIHVYPSSERGRTEGLTGAVVTVSQKGNRTSKTTTKDGMAIFEGLVEGDATIYVEASGFAAINKNVTLSRDSDFANRDKNHTVDQGVTEIVSLPALGAGIRGNLIWDNDRVDATPMVAANGFSVRYELNDKTIQPNVFYTTTDAQGKYVFTNVANAAGTVKVDTAITLSNQVFTYTYSSAATAQLGDQLDLGEGTLAATGNVVAFNGTVRFRLWGEFDGARPESPSTSFRPERDEVLKPGITGMLVDPVIMVDDANYPKTLNNKFTVANSTDDVLTFSNLPIGYELKVVYLYRKDVSVGTSDSCLVLGTTQRFEPISGYTTYTSKCTDNVVAYTQALTFGGIQGFPDEKIGKLNLENQVLDLGEVQATR